MGNLQLKYVTSWENAQNYCFFSSSSSMFPRSLDWAANPFQTLTLPSSPEYRIRPYLSAFMLCLLHHFLNVIFSDVFWMALALETFTVFAAI
jgi:hypothetical protein